MTKNNFYKVLHSVLKSRVEQEDKLAAINALLYSFGVYYKTETKFRSDHALFDEYQAALNEHKTVEQLFYNEMSCNAMEFSFDMFGELLDRVLNFGGINCSIRSSNGKTFGELQIERNAQTFFKQKFSSTLYRD
jgi:hypothetical protein